MSIDKTMYDSDGILREPQSAFEIERRARGLRALRLAALVNSFFDWLEARARAAWRGRAEAYLAQATDLADLERRMRRLERRGELFG